MDDLTKMSGSLHLIFGCMFSGKTTELIRRLDIYSKIGKKVLYINSSIDTRGEDFSTHNQTIKKSGLFDIIKAESLDEIDVSEYDVVGVDEAQFFPDLYSVGCWVEHQEKQVFVTSLDGDSNRQIFGHAGCLLPLCDEVVKLTAYCAPCSKEKIYRPAIFTHCLQKKTEVVLVGAGDEYIPVCRECYRKLSLADEIEDEEDEDEDEDEDEEDSSIPALESPSSSDDDEPGPDSRYSDDDFVGGVSDIIDLAGEKHNFPLTPDIKEKLVNRVLAAARKPYDLPWVEGWIDERFEILINESYSDSEI